MRTIPTKNVVARHTEPGFQAILLGHQPRTTTGDNKCAHGFYFTNLLGAQPTHIYRIVAPSNENGRGFGTISTADDESTVFAEGVLLQETQSGAFIEHADCPVGIIHNRKTRNLVVFHAGRPALVPHDGQNIVTTALNRIARKDEIDALSVYISGSICGTHFENRSGQAKEHAEQILEEFGPDVFTDVEALAFSPAELIKWQLLNAGLSLQQITHDGTCTFANSRLDSHRKHVIYSAERTTANMTVVATN